MIGFQKWHPIQTSKNKILLKLQNMSKDKESPPVPSEGGESGEASDNDTSLFNFEESVDNKGLTRVFTHIVKPIANLNDPKKRKKSLVITKKY